MIMDEFFNNLEETERKYFEHAYVAAMCSPGISRGKFRIGAILTDNKRIVSVGFNQYKTHPKLAKYSDHPFLHAETHSMIRHGLDNCEGLTMYILRYRKGGDVGMAKPCDVCMHMIKESGISKIYYTTSGQSYILDEF